MDPQQQFLDVLDRDEAERRFHAVIQAAPLEAEWVGLDQALGRVLADDVTSPVDVPSFDRSNFDGYAVRAADTYGASEQQPRRMTLTKETIATAVVPQIAVTPAHASTIATGGMVPKGADAILMVEHAEMRDGELFLHRPITPGFGIAFAGTDIARGETVLRRGQSLTSRETGVAAAVGITRVSVRRRPRIAIISTGDEIIEPGHAMRPGLVYDSNARILADAIRELGAEPVVVGIVTDDHEHLRACVQQGLASYDMVLLSGGTSKGAGDISYRVVQELTDPGIVVHGVALKPGKPICLAAHHGKPVVILPGFPTSAIFTFHEFVAPVISQMAGHSHVSREKISARMAFKINSEIGRTEYLLVHLVKRSDSDTAANANADTQLIAYPMGKGSGSVTTFSHADGFVTIDRYVEQVEAGAVVSVQLLGKSLQLADLIVMGSHCLGLDYLLGCLQERGFRTKFLAVGSTAGLAAVRRGEGDLAGIHLLSPESGEYNRPYMTGDLQLLPGYGRMQGVVYRSGDARFAGKTAREAVAAAARDSECVMVNRNQGSGTRVLIDQLLAGHEPNGYAAQARNHNAVAAAVAQQRADWGIAIESAARQAGLDFLPLAHEQFDFAVAKSRWQRPAVVAFRELCCDAQVVASLRERGFSVPH